MQAFWRCAVLLLVVHPIVEDRTSVDAAERTARDCTSATAGVYDSRASPECVPDTRDRQNRRPASVASAGSPSSGQTERPAHRLRRQWCRIGMLWRSLRGHATPRPIGTRGMPIRERLCHTRGVFCIPSQFSHWPLSLSERPNRPRYAPLRDVPPNTTTWLSTLRVAVTIKHKTGTT